MAIVAVAMAVVSLAIRDPAQDQLEKEAARLVALLESARAEARANSTEVRWVVLRGQTTQLFGFASGASNDDPPPMRWLDERVQAQVVGSNHVVLGPDPILPAQRITLSLDEHRLEIASDGLSSFAVTSSPSPGTP